MNAEERIRRSLLIEKMEKKKSYCRKLRLEDVSTFHGKQIKKMEDKSCWS